jgi:isocitrate dehydrogenase (NAD+)
MFGLSKSLMSTRALVSMSMMSNRGLARRQKDRVTATLIPGDGVGPELMASVEEVFKAAAVPVDFEVYFMSEVHSSQSSPIRSVVDSISRNGICLKGVLTTPSFSASGETDTLNIRMRKSLDLYANVVKVSSLPGVKTRHSAVDLVVIREQTEGE